MHWDVAAHGTGWMNIYTAPAKLRRLSGAGFGSLPTWVANAKEWLRRGKLLFPGLMTLSAMPRMGEKFGASSHVRSTSAPATDSYILITHITMLLRFESANGQFRLSVEPTDTFSSLTGKVGSSTTTASQDTVLLDC
jgi:hypothetical protein